MDSRPQLFYGKVMHRRLRPAFNQFIYPVFYVQLPLSRLEDAANAVFSIDRFNLLSLHQRDHGARDGSPLLPWIRQQLQQCGLPADGKVVLQTFPRVLGWTFNPVSFWYCHDRAGQLIAVLAEVNNTFGGRHSYLLHNPGGEPLRDGQPLQADKTLHVSPFCRVEGSYRFRFRLERPTQLARIDYDDGAGELLTTSLTGASGGWGLRPLLGALLRMPLLPLGVVARIHWQAFRLWWKGVSFHGARPPVSSSLKETAK